MASFGTVEIEARLDARRVLAVIHALDMLRGLLVDTYDHAWTDEEKATLTEAVAAVERENLAYAVKEPG
jgi:hypothetical protein